MSEAGPDAEVVFELTVEGELGPVLRCALQPDAVERQPSTTFRATAGAGLGVADLVGMLDAEGLTVESIRVAGLR
ncbi:hypothetical protein SAMN05428985_104509 [Nocardioides sp. YR527]|uniref:hypothetical protein n=1 Tax=Nocardioides sp. YR527 TaxID=1881028 RepID=UPI0008923ED8|nr:hypothetical protein [Nocardioides sp. YR527]SDK56185.1 hypothetical protein SAMN05428985_104509 [Nocardioides sp. YR527]